MTPLEIYWPNVSPGTCFTKGWRAHNTNLIKIHMAPLFKKWVIYPIKWQFCTCHDSWAVVACAKLSLDWMVRINIRAIRTFYEISMLSSIAVIWSSGSCWCELFCFVICLDKQLWSLIVWWHLYGQIVWATVYIIKHGHGFVQLFSCFVLTTILCEFTYMI